MDTGVAVLSLITTVTCNTAIDKIYRPARIRTGKLLRVEEAAVLPGGKGINAARVLRRLGQPVLATGFVAGFNGAWLRHQLDKEGITHDFIEVEGETRLAITIPDPDGRRQTEILESGPTITGDDEVALLGTVGQWARQSRAVALCGSLPPGASADLYLRLAEAVQAYGVPVALDTSGEPLKEGLKARPFLVKPNQDEFLGLAGPLRGWRALRQAAEEWSARSGAEWFIVTLGEKGALAIHRAIQPGMPGWWSAAAVSGHESGEPEIFRIGPSRVRPVKTVGSGDSFLGGFLAGWAAGRDPEGCLRLAAACAAANLMVAGPGAIEKKMVEELELKVEIERWA